MEFEGDETEQNPNITNTVVEDDDDPPMLSSHSLDALKEFLNEQKQQQQSTTSISSDEISLVSEDWRLSQFWYHPETAEMVAGEVRRLSVVASSPVACIACPTLYAYLKKLDPSICAKILEYDRRFEQYGSDFTFYDYNLPEELAPELKHAFRVVVVDPPYLSKECLEKVARTIEFLLRPGESYLLLLTGDVQRERAAELLNLYPCGFRPQHSSKLGNEFRLFTNYDPGERLESTKIVKTRSQSSREAASHRIKQLYDELAMRYFGSVNLNGPPLPPCEESYEGMCETEAALWREDFHLYLSDADGHLASNGEESSSCCPGQGTG